MTAKIKNGFFGPMKGLDSAKHGLEEIPGGCLRAWIEHDVMTGVTPEMLRWWFELFYRSQGRRPLAFDRPPNHWAHPQIRFQRPDDKGLDPP